MAFIIVFEVDRQLCSWFITLYNIVENLEIKWFPVIVKHQVALFLAFCTMIIGLHVLIMKYKTCLRKLNIHTQIKSLIQLRS